MRPTKFFITTVLITKQLITARLCRTHNAHTTYTAAEASASQTLPLRQEPPTKRSVIYREDIFMICIMKRCHLALVATNVHVLARPKLIRTAIPQATQRHDMPHFALPSERFLSGRNEALCPLKLGRAARNLTARDPHAAARSTASADPSNLI